MKTTCLTLLLILAIGLIRFLPHPENLTPLAAFALIGGFYLGKRFALWVPLAALILSDLILNIMAGYSAFHWPRLIDWSVFVLIGVAALAVRQRGWQAKVATTFAAPLGFFAVSNFGVWLTGLSLSGLPYDKSLAGLGQCYLAGVPFLRGTLIGDWGFVALFALIHLLATRSERRALSLTSCNH